MTAGVSRQMPGAAPMRPSGARRLGIAVLGVATVVVGLFLLFHPYSAARTLALLIGAGLVVGGVLEMTAAWRAPHRGPWMALGAALAIVGVIAAFWPRLTLGALALLTGLSLIVHGACRIGLAIVARREIPHWGWLAVAGVVSVVIGLLVLAWPEATVLVLSLFLGAQLALFGVVLTVGAFLPAGDRTGLPPAT